MVITVLAFVTTSDVCVKILGEPACRHIEGWLNGVLKNLLDPHSLRELFLHVWDFITRVWHYTEHDVWPEVVKRFGETFRHLRFR
jgi:hypothetical protein